MTDQPETPPDEATAPEPILTPDEAAAAEEAADAVSESAPGEPVAVAREPHVPSVTETIQTALAALIASGGDLRVLSIVAVVFGTVFVAVPFVAFFAFAITGPLYVAFGAAVDQPFLQLSIPAFAAFFVGFIAFFVFTIQFPLMVTAMIGGRISGTPLGLREALRRARQVFWRALRASILVGLVTSIPAAVIGYVVGQTVGQTQLATGANILTSIVLSSPWVYVLPGIVLGGVGAVESLRRSLRLARFKWRLALTIAALGVLGAQIVLAAALAALGAVGTVLSLAPGSTQIAESPPPALIALAVLVGAVVVSSLFFATQAVEVAPETSGFYALTGYAAALDQARGGKPEPLLRLPARVVYAVGLLAAAVLAIGILSTWPVAERGPWQRWAADGITFEVPVGWRKQFEDPAGAAFTSGGGSVSVEFDVTGSTVEALAARHLLSLQTLQVAGVTQDSSDELTIADRPVREVVATAEAGGVPFPISFRMVMEIGRIDGRDYAFIVDCPASNGPVQDFYSGEAKRFARHIWASALTAS